MPHDSTRKLNIAHEKFVKCEILRAGTRGY